MLSFYPGPSKVHPKSLEFIQEAYQKGIVSCNHRSKIFEALYQDTQEILHEKWGIPASYTIYFVSSASECWEIVSQSVVIHQSAHFYNGAFGEKWAKYNATWNPNSKSFPFSIQQSISEFLKGNIDYSKADTICLVQSETSNGSGQTINRKQFAQNLDATIAVDATSSMGGIKLPWQEADIWFASVQKCMGLPAGMGVLICSPKALEQANKKGKRASYHDLLFLEENRLKNQTHFTPNVLSIYLLNKLTHYLPPINEIHAQTFEKMHVLERFFEQIDKKSCDFLIENSELRLPTVLALKGNEAWIQSLFIEAEKNGIILGKGYGEWKNSSFRIANFPSHTQEDIRQLTQFLQKHGI